MLRRAGRGRRKGEEEEEEGGCPRREEPSPGVPGWVGGEGAAANGALGSAGPGALWGGVRSPAPSCGGGGPLGTGLPLRGVTGCTCL